MKPQIVLLLLSMLANTSLGVLVLLRTYRLLYGWLFAATVFGVAIWSLGDILLLTLSTTHYLHVAELLFYVGPMFIPVSILLFSLYFLSPAHYRLSAKTLVIILLPLIVGSLIIIIDPGLIIGEVALRPHALNVALPRQPGFLFYTLHFSAYFMATYIVLFLKLKKSRGLNSVQLSYTLYGVLAASIPALITNLSFPTMHISSAIWLGPIFTLIFITSVSLAIIRYKLFDIRAVIVRAFAYLFSLTLLSAIYIMPSILLVAWIMHIRFTWSRFLVAAVVALSFAVFYGKMRGAFDRFTNSLFYRGYYEPQDVLNQLTEIMVGTIDTEVLKSQSAQLLKDTLRINKFEYQLVLEHPFKVEGLLRKLFTKRGTTNIVTLDDASQHNVLQTEPEFKDVGVVLRLRTNRGDIGAVLVGYKASGEPFSTKDKRLLSIAADSISISLQNAIQIQEIQNFNQTLQEKVALATKELRRSNEKLKHLDETKDDFISMASHQLRTPLTSVKGYLSLVLEGDAGKLNAQQRKLLTQAYSSSQRMVYLISDLLNVSRLSTGKFVIDPTPVNLADVISDEIAQLQETAALRELKLLYDKPKDFPQMMLDETKIRQVIMNFIDNAIYYTPSGGEIRVELADKPSVIELRVIDSGIGVPRSEQHHLFTKFYRAGNARQARPDGTGLGLFMAKKVIVAQRGALLFESEEGKGSTFGFTFSKSQLAVQATPLSPEK